MSSDTTRVASLIRKALEEGEPNLHKHVAELRATGSEEVLKAAIGLCRSGDWVRRDLGAEILGQLGLPSQYAFLQESVTELMELCDRERTPAVLSTVAHALGSRGDPRAIPCLLRLHTHPEPDVRKAVAVALPFVMSDSINEKAMLALLRLSEDPDPETRDWATVGLGTQLSEDSQRVREALCRRLHDDHLDTRAEALYGLALRGDKRVVPALQKELDSDYVGKLVVRAAATIGDSRLHQSLKKLREWWDVDQQLLDEAIRRTKPKAPS